MFYRVLGVATLGLTLCVLNVDAGGAKKKTEGATGTIEIKKNEEKGTYRFLIKGADGKGFVMPLPQMNWESKAEALKALEDLKAILANGKVVDVKDTTPEKKAAKKDEKKDAKKDVK